MASIGPVEDNDLVFSELDGNRIDAVRNNIIANDMVSIQGETTFNVGADHRTVLVVVNPTQSSVTFTVKKPNSSANGMSFDSVSKTVNVGEFAAFTCDSRYFINDKGYITISTDGMLYGILVVLE